jgi:monofunctional biosynthetic peptidoglycan transglycosylase
VLVPVFVWSWPDNIPSVRTGGARRSVQIATGAAAVAFACITYSWLTLPDVRVLRKQNPASTAFMRMRIEDAARDGKTIKPSRVWLSYGRISPTLKRAVLVTEDAGFWDHDGVDYTELRAAVEAGWTKGGIVRGASTITQQLAKNLYLSPSRNPYRKFVELMITRRLEAELSKARILELYLNLIEWGNNVWGAEAAARTYFGRSASDLSVEQAALLAGAIINPRVYSPARPNARLLRRQQMIIARLGSVTPPAPPPASVPEPFPPASPN